MTSNPKRSASILEYILDHRHDIIHKLHNNKYFEQTDDEFNEAIQKKAEMILEQETFLLKKETERQIKISAYQKLGLTQEEIDALMPPEPEPELLIGSN